MQNCINVTHQEASAIKNTREGTIKIHYKEYYVWCGTLYETYGNFGYCDEVEIFVSLEEKIGDYHIRLTHKTISIYFEGVNTLNNIDVSNIPLEAKRLTFYYLVSLFQDR